MGERFKREGTYVHLWLIHVDVWQKPTQYCKAVILQLKIIKCNYFKNFPKEKADNEIEKYQMKSLNGYFIRRGYLNIQ